jgi:hypothetical protein
MMTPVRRLKLDVLLALFPNSAASGANARRLQVEPRPWSEPFKVRRAAQRARARKKRRHELAVARRGPMYIDPQEVAFAAFSADGRRNGLLYAAQLGAAETTSQIMSFVRGHPVTSLFLATLLGVAGRVFA